MITNDTILNSRNIAVEDRNPVTNIQEEYPNPMLQVSLEGVLFYKNKASDNISDECKLESGKIIPEILFNGFLKFKDKKVNNEEYEFKMCDKYYFVEYAFSSDRKFIILYIRENKYRKNVEFSLEQNRSNFRHLVDSASDIFYITDENGYLLYFNKQFLHVFGLSYDELIGQHYSTLIREDKKNEANQFFDNQLKNKISVTNNKFPIVNYGEEEIWLESSVQIIYNNEQEISGFLGIARDITKREKEETYLTGLLKELETKNRELQDKQKYLKIINNFAADILKTNKIEDIVWVITQNVIHEFSFEDCVVYLIDEEKEFLYQVAAYGPKNPQGKIIKDPIQIPMGKGIVGSVALSGLPEIIHDTSKDQRYICDDQRRLSEISIPILAEGEVIGVIDAEHSKRGFFTEDHKETLITIAGLVSMRIKSALMDEKNLKAEIALKDSELKLKSVIYSALDSVIIIDDQGLVIEWNPRSFEIFGFTSEETVGKPLRDFIIPVDDHERFVKGIQDFIETGQGSIIHHREETTCLNKEGLNFPVELSIIPIQLDGNLFFSVFVRDITLEKETRLEMKKALEKEKELNELKSRFVSMTSHEFRTPLTTIQINVDIISFLAKSQDQDFNKKTGKNFTRISSEIDRLTRLMNDILLIGKIDGGKLPFKPKKVDLTILCSDIINQSFSNMSDGRKVDFGVKGKKVKVMIDPNIFTHIIANLVGNSFKYSKKYNPKLNILFTEQHVEIKFEDSGIGIKKAEIKKLFDSFYRGSNVDNIQGTGLGLTIVKQFVELHNGTIEVESILNKKTTFTIKIPLN